MFSVAELKRITDADAFREDWGVVLRSQAEHRLAQRFLIAEDAAWRLQRFIRTVLVSAPGWDDEAGRAIAAQAAQAAEMLALSPDLELDRRRLRLRSSLLYELADQPAMAAAVLQHQDGPEPLVQLFKRQGPFRSLGAPPVQANPRSGNGELARLAISQDAQDLAAFQQGPADRPLLPDSDALQQAAASFILDLNLSEIRAFEAIVRRRASRSTRHSIPQRLLADAHATGMPAELWAHQSELLHAGLLDPHTTWGVAAPTGTGKTFMARLMVLSALSGAPGTKVLYIVPSNALVHQVAHDLAESFERLSVGVTAVTPQLVALGEHEDAEVSEADVLVLTPEKADLLLRIGAEFLADVALVVVDEAHHIENGTRGVLLELYLTRLKARFAGQARYVLLSAVTPNVDELARWISPHARSRMFRERATRMRVGVYRIKDGERGGEGWLEYVDGARVRAVPGRIATGQAAALIQLAAHISIAGPVLVVAEGQGTAESLARRLRDRLAADAEPDVLSEDEQAGDVIQRLDARLEREMYSEVELRDLLRYRVAYHHAGLPPRVREALEAAISAGHIRYVIATTTLGEGVNFPFSSVIVQALAIRNPPQLGRPVSHRLVTPRTFWNIAGRAGRPGYDHEGQVILYEPSLGLEKVDAVLDPYITAAIEDIDPVTSALGQGLQEIHAALADGAITAAQLSSVELDGEIPRPIQGVVNLLRVGIAHARASDMGEAPDELFDSTLAARTVGEEHRGFARRFFAEQTDVVDHYLRQSGAPPVRLVAELGLSLDTLSRLRGYVDGLENWQIEQMGHIVIGGRINFRALRFVVAPVLKRMAELEGERLGGLYTETVVEWCMGKPFAAIPLLKRQKKLEDLIKLVYSKIGYLLPWGLYAFDRFIDEVAQRREVTYAGEVQSLAYLVDGGVPDMAALALTTRGFERSDAARLSRAYYSSREARETTDIVRWLRAQPYERLLATVRGVDNRRIDHDFRRLVNELRPTVA